VRQSQTHRGGLVHFAGAGFAGAMRLVPRRYRFRVAMLAARAAEPFLQRTAPFRLQQKSGVDGPREIAAYVVLRILTRHGTEFDPDIDVRGWDELVRAYNDGRGVLVAVPHMALMQFLLRLSHDRGLSMLGITAEREPIYGTRVAAPTMAPSPTFLVTARNRLRRGGFVSAMLDRGEHQPLRTVEVQTDNGSVIVAPALLRIAAACGAQVLFMEMHVDGRRLAGTIVPAASDSVEGLTREFAEFVRAHVAARAGAAA
jgi:lauroyl/myristoyl acyltransferase